MKLCKGFAVAEIVENELRETLFAELPDGRVLSTGCIIATCHFDRSHRVWWPVQAVPDNAQYIGTYPIPGAMPERP